MQDHKPSYVLTSTIAIILGALATSFSPIFIKVSTLAPSVSGFYRMFFATCVLGVGVLCAGGGRVDWKRSLFVLVAAALALSLDIWFWHTSIGLIGPGISTLLANLQVFILPLISWWWYSVSVPRTVWFLSALALLGLTLMCVESGQLVLGADYLRGTVFGLQAAVCYAFYISLMKHTMPKTDSASFRALLEQLFWVTLLTTCLLRIIVGLENESIGYLSSQELVLMLSNGAITHAGAWLLILYGLMRVSTVSAGLILMLQPVGVLFLDQYLFSSTLTFQQCLGVFMIITALFLKTVL